MFFYQLRRIEHAFKFFRRSQCGNFGVQKSGDRRLVAVASCHAHGGNDLSYSGLGG